MGVTRKLKTRSESYFAGFQKVEQSWRLQLSRTSGEVRNTYKVGKQFSLELNFGEIEFDWDQEAVLIRAIGKDPDAPPLLSASYSFDELNGEVDIPGRTTTIALSERYGQHQMDGYVIGDGKYLCMNHRAPYSRHGVLFGYGAILSLAFSFFLIPQLILCLAIYKLFSRRAPRSK